MPTWWLMPRAYQNTPLDFQREKTNIPTLIMFLSLISMFPELHCDIRKFIFIWSMYLQAQIVLNVVILKYTFIYIFSKTII